MPNPDNNSNDNMTIGLHVYPDYVIGLRSNNIYNICMYTMKNNKSDNLIPLMAMLKLNKLPRFYIGCFNKCDQIINPSNMGSMINKQVCQRTERTAEHCHPAQFLLYGIKMIIYVINLINSQPRTLQEKTETFDSWQSLRKSNNRKHNKDSGKYIYIQVEKPKIRKNIKIKRTVNNRKSPIPHTRRGHYRHLKSGKVIWVQMTHVGLKEKAREKKKIYKIK